MTETPIPTLTQPNWVKAVPVRDLQELKLPLQTDGRFQTDSRFANVLGSLGPSELADKRPDVMAEMVAAKDTLSGHTLAYLNAAQKYDIGKRFGEDMKKSLDAIKDLFRDFGMPLIDQFRITQSPNGTFHVSGWGKGAAISHPQEKFMEAVLNGTEPELSGLHDALMKHIADIEDIFDSYQTKRAQVEGDSFTPSESFFQGSGMMFGVEFPEHDAARKLAWNNPDAYQSFKDNLGSELALMGSETQILSHFYFQTVTLPNLPASLKAFL